MMEKGPTFLVSRSTKATMQMTKLFQSMKFSGVARLIAAIAMSAIVAGFSPVITPWKSGWLRNLSYTLQMESTMMKGVVHICLS